jgi:hypothetical protein
MYVKRKLLFFPLKESVFPIYVFHFTHNSDLSQVIANIAKVLGIISNRTTHRRNVPEIRSAFMP